jgi:putative Holliday junction resolvase
MRVLGIDYGTVRVGVAMSDPLRMIAQPLEVIEYKSTKELLAGITGICAEYEIGEIVIGLPKHMGGDESESSEKARKLGALLKHELNKKVFFQDERLSTVAAEKAMIEADVSRKKRKKKIDSIAASIILQTYLDSAF